MKAKNLFKIERRSELKRAYYIEKKGEARKEKRDLSHKNKKFCKEYFLGILKS